MYRYKNLYKIWLRKLYSLNFHLVLVVTRYTEKFKSFEKGYKIIFTTFWNRIRFHSLLWVMQQKIVTKFKLRFSRVFRALKYCPSSTVHFPLTEHPFLNICFLTGTSYSNLDYVYPSSTLGNKMIGLFWRQHFYSIYFGIKNQLN